MTIVPLRPQPSAPALATPDPLARAAERGGGSFEDFLTAMLRDAEDFLGRGGAKEATPPACPPHVAELFNEAGFFPSAASVPAPAQPVSAPAEEAVVLATDAAAPALDILPVAAAAELEHLPAAQPQTALAGRAAAPVPAVRTQALPPPRHVQAAPRPAAAAAGAPPPRSTISTVERSAAARHAAPPPRPATEGAALGVQLSLQAAGTEVSLAARVQALSRDERARLRAGIAELLARHGFSARSISLNGEVGRARPQQGE